MIRRFLSPSISAEDVDKLSVAPLHGVEAELYNDLWNAVIDRKLRPGVKIEEAVLCDIYGISRTLTRKVFHIMEQEGIVELPPNRGAYIAKPTRDQAEQLLEAVVVLLKHFVAALATRVLNDEEIERLESHLSAERDANLAHNFHVARRLRGEFCTLLGLMNGNRVLAGTMDRYMIRWTLALALYQEAQVAGSNEFCAAVVKAIIDRDEAMSERIISQQERMLFHSLQQIKNEEIDLRSILGRKKSGNT